jgi:hypothetical protein
MRLHGRLLGRITLSAVVLLTVSLAPAGSHASASHGPLPQAVTYRAEVRLRKLHLVRPDLIPYPIQYEIYC